MKHAVLGGFLAAAMSASVSADTLSFDFNWGPTGSSAPLVGLGVKINSGSASVGAITGGSTWGLGAGWYQQTLADSFAAGSNSDASRSQYGFVRGGGGDTAGTADSITGPVGSNFSLILDQGYTPSEGQSVEAIWAYFKADGTLSAQGLVTWTFTSGAWDRTYSFNAGWSQVDSGTFAELSAGVVPGPMGVAAIAGLGLAGRRRRR